MSEWQPIETVDLSLESVDLFGYISYDCIQMRLTDYEQINGEWHYFCAGEMLHIDTIGFHPTHWMPLPDDPE